jgi:hypothetical protein
VQDLQLRRDDLHLARAGAHQEPDTDCVDPTNGVALWASALQTAPAVIDRSVTAPCQAGLSPVCAATWSDKVSRWRGQTTLTDQAATFAGQRASTACLKRHRTTCWRSAGFVWDPSKEPSITSTS